ncbi:MAG: hypothetical protein FJY92_05440, partial [Candidatus Hydrogenedentes bacterium]|nr:hypothetical protein [Candidatus Hydrogenedentota bacterium]
MPRGSTVFDDDSVLGANAPVPMGPPIDIRRIVMLRLPVFLITVAVTAPVLVPLAWLFAPRDYVAAAEIRFLSQRPRIMDSEAQGGDFARTYEKFVSTQVALITGTSILTQALEDPAVSGIPEIASAGDKLEFLRDHLSARLRSGTELLVIECSMARRESAQRVLETVVKVYMDGASRQLATAGSERLSVLMTERDTRKDDLEKLQRQLVALQSQLGTDASAGTATEDKELLLYRESLVKSQDDVSRAEQDVRAAEQRAIEAEKLSQTYQSNPGTSVGGPDVQAVVETDARVVTLAEQVAAAQLGVVTAQGQYVKGSAKLARAEEALAALESQLDQARQRVTGEVLRGKAHALRLEVDAYKGKVSEAEERVAKYNQFIADRSKAIEDKAGDY